MADYIDALLESNAQNTAFNAAQADLNRDWQTWMSGTSHQREVADLVAAGLNPVLSANSGSSWQSVGNAVSDPTAAQGFANLAATFMNNQASIEISKIQAEATKAAAAASAGGMIAAAGISAEATRFAAEQSSSASRYASEQSAGAAKYSANTSTVFSGVPAMLGRLTGFIA